MFLLQSNIYGQLTIIKFSNNRIWNWSFILMPGKLRNYVTDWLSLSFTMEKTHTRKTCQSNENNVQRKPFQQEWQWKKKSMPTKIPSSRHVQGTPCTTHHLVIPSWGVRKNIILFIKLGQEKMFFLRIYAFHVKRQLNTLKTQK